MCPAWRFYGERENRNAVTLSLNQCEGTALRLGSTTPEGNGWQNSWRTNFDCQQSWVANSELLGFKSSGSFDQHESIEGNIGILLRLYMLLRLVGKHIPRVCMWGNLCVFFVDVRPKPTYRPQSDPNENFKKAWEVMIFPWKCWWLKRMILILVIYWLKKLL